MIPRIQYLPVGWIQTSITIIATASLSGAAVVHSIADPPFETDRTTGIADLDVDGDGRVDLQISNDSSSVMLLPTLQNRVVEDLLDSTAASLLIGTSIGEVIDTEFYEWVYTRRISEDFALGPSFQFCASNGGGRFCLGNFLTEPGFIGIEFDIGGELHYGWLRAIGHPNNVRSTIFEWAYEDVPGRAIAAGAIPEPGVTLLSLAGVLCLALRRWRRTE
jgi:hypothetical protein